MRLEHLTLANFKGVSRFVFAPDGKDRTVFGDNGTGKTTLADAMCWLLTGKDARGNAQFEIKSLDAEGRAASGLEHEVSGLFTLVDDGRTISLKKVYVEKWTKRRGAAEKEFTGHITNHFVDGVPCTQKEYKEAITDLIAPEEVIRLLTMPAYFATMPWEARRRLVLEVCGDVSDQDIISSSPDLAELNDFLQAGRSIEQQKKVVAAQKAEINKELEKIPVRISEVNRGMAEPGDIIDAAVEQGNAFGLRKQIAGLDAEIARINAGDAVAKISMDLAAAEQKLAGLVSAGRQEIGGKILALSRKSVGFEAAIDRIEREIAGLEDNRRRREQDIIKADAKIEALEDGRFAWFARAFGDNSTCSACGHELSTESVAAARAEFNMDKAKALKENARLAQEQEESRELLLQQITDLKKEIGALATTMADQRANLARLLREIAALENTAKLLPAAGQVETETEISALQIRLDELAAVGPSAELATIQGKKDELAQKLETAEARILQAGQQKKAASRIDELRVEQRKLAGEYEGLERQLHLMEQFTRAKVRILEEHVASKFELARFRMFEDQINGGLADCCTVLGEGGVPYGDGLNHGAEIQVGMDIIKTLSHHYGVAMPLWIDNRESVVRLPEMNCQVFSLVVSEQDKTLRVVKNS